MKLEKWKTFTTDEVVRIACELYATLGGEKIDPNHCVEVWRDDSMKGKSAVYSIEHGFLLGSSQQGLTVRVAENWAGGDKDDSRVATAVRLQSCGHIGFSVRYRLGQLSVEIRADAGDAERCAARFRELCAP